VERQVTAHIHPTALVEPGVEIGEGSSIWDHVHIRSPARIGGSSSVGGRSYIAYGVVVGDRVKINSQVYVPTGVTIDDGVMVAAGVIFTNDRYPRATTPDLRELRGSSPDQHTRPTRVREGATLGAGSVIGCDLEIGRFAMVGMGAVVTRSVPDFHMVVGNPAAPAAAVCRCGQPFLRFANGMLPDSEDVPCPACGLRYRTRDGGVHEQDPP
jgi:UDP-2-acetamido-3-amino-2,3-dideoxy-glucuronate N-acetyltransferase